MIDLQIEGKEGVWSATDYSSDDLVSRTFCAHFSSNHDALEFQAVFKEVIYKINYFFQSFLLNTCMFRRNDTQRSLTFMTSRTRRDLNLARVLMDSFPDVNVLKYSLKRIIVECFHFSYI